jgi:hypothetical protein
MMAYDAADGYVVLFGGANSTGWSNQTWKYVGGVWTQLHPTRSPSYRFDGMMAYDRADKEVVLFGGVGAGANCAPNGYYCNDTWTFTGGQWTMVTSSPSGPGPLAYGSMAYDPHLGSVVLFGGFSNPSGYIVNPSYSLHSFSKGSWTLRPSGAGPFPPFARSSIAFDARDGYLVEFGGDNVSGLGPGPNASTWNFSHRLWTNLTPIKHPSWRLSDNLVFDPKLGYLVMFGGVLAPTYTSGPNTTSVFSGGSWTQLHPKVSPPGEVAPAMATYDAADGYLLLFGGQNSTSSIPSNDTWVFTWPGFRRPAPRWW